MKTVRNFNRRCVTLQAARCSARHLGTKRVFLRGLSDTSALFQKDRSWRCLHSVSPAGAAKQIGEGERKEPGAHSVCCLHTSTNNPTTSTGGLVPPPPSPPPIYDKMVCVPISCIHTSINGNYKRFSSSWRGAARYGHI